MRRQSRLPSGDGAAAGHGATTLHPLAGAPLLAAACRSLGRGHPQAAMKRPQAVRQQQRQTHQLRWASQGLAASPWVALPWRGPLCSGRCSAC